MFSLLKFKTIREFSVRLSTRKDLMKYILQFCSQTFTYNNMKESIAAEEEEGEENKSNQDKHEAIVENIKKCIEGISRSDEEETTRINYKDNKEEEIKDIIKEK